MASLRSREPVLPPEDCLVPDECVVYATDDAGHREPVGFQVRASAPRRTERGAGASPQERSSVLAGGAVTQEVDKMPELPLLVFINSKSGANAGKQMLAVLVKVGLSPVQIVDIIKEGPNKRCVAIARRVPAHAVLNAALCSLEPRSTHTQTAALGDAEPPVPRADLRRRWHHWVGLLGAGRRKATGPRDCGASPSGHGQRPLPRAWVGQRLQRATGTMLGQMYDSSHICRSRKRAFCFVLLDGNVQVARVLHKLQDTTSVHLDRWTVAIQLRDGAGLEEVVMNNYFSIGCATGRQRVCTHARPWLISRGTLIACGGEPGASMGAQVVLQFDQGRKRNPQLYSSRLFNKAVYAWDGLKDSIVHSCKDLHLRIRVEVRTHRSTNECHRCVRFTS